jgi:hypothetical protein
VLKGINLEAKSVGVKSPRKLDFTCTRERGAKAHCIT